MKIISWNVRVLNALKKQRLVLCCMKASKLEVVLLQETKVNKEKILSFTNKLGYWEVDFFEAMGSAGGLAILWNPRKVSYSHFSLNNH